MNGDDLWVVSNRGSSGCAKRLSLLTGLRIRTDACSALNVISVGTGRVWSSTQERLKASLE